MGALYDSGLYPDDPIISTPHSGHTAIRPGVIVAYRLCSHDNPINPHKVWRGKVRWSNDKTICVELLEQGYKDLQEIIHYSQIVGVE